MVKGKKRKKEGFELGVSDSQTVSLTTCPWEHEATGLTAHKHTYIHVLSYGGPKKMAAIRLLSFRSLVYAVALGRQLAVYCLDVAVITVASLVRLTSIAAVPTGAIAT